MSIDLTKIKRVRTPNGTEFEVNVREIDGSRVMVPFCVHSILACDFAALIEAGCFTPVAESVEVPLGDWEPQEGDIVEWANGERYAVSIPGWVRMPHGCVADMKSSKPIIRAAKCKIWRDQ